MAKEDKIEERVLKHARLFIKRNATIRSVAKETGWSKSTVDKDLRVRLPLIHMPLFEKVTEKIVLHRSVRHIRGGESTRRKWEKKNGKNQTP